MQSKPLEVASPDMAFDDLEDATPSSRLRRIWLILRRKLQFALDGSVLLTAFSLSYLLRFDFAIPEKELSQALLQLPFVLVIQFAALYAFGTHKFIWRYIGMTEINAFLRAAGASFVPIIALRLFPHRFYEVRIPLSVILMDTILAFGGVVGLRVLRRALYELYKKQERTARTASRGKKPILLIGTGRAGVLAAREMQNSDSLGLKVAGFIDDDHESHGSLIQGIKVVGGIKDLPRLVDEMGIDHVVIAIPKAPRDKIREVIRACGQIRVKTQIISGLQEMPDGKAGVGRMRDVQIEDLLGRDPVHLDEEEMEQFLVGKSVMVTGAGGSIGSELARQAVRFRPSSLLLVERAEPALFHIDRELRANWPQQHIVPLVADVGDKVRMRSIFSAHCPQVVLHAAAHKHVPMMELNLTEAVKNNVLATHTLGELSGAFGVEKFVLISSDKAVRPTSVMGASKRVAELVIQCMNQSYQTTYVAVRFGNVIGSAGSVIPIFCEQIRKGGPVTVTHPDMVRYFMTIPEAAQLVLQAGAMGEGGEIFVLDMGEPVRIMDLARETIALSGLRPFEDIDIVFTGMRPGEKLVEELQTSGEHMTRTRHSKILIGKIAAYPEDKVRQALVWFASFSDHGQEQALRRFLSQLLPEAQLETGRSVAAQTREEFSGGPQSVTAG